jgi:hypothetical protein
VQRRPIEPDERLESRVAGFCEQYGADACGDIVGPRAAFSASRCRARFCSFVETRI